ncbi:MAG: colicin V production protein, partial [Acidobacteriota bacterium]|nr:colicin V production protein [Acidobacteriota bacterium]
PIAHTGLMNSPGHRANILQPNFGRVGIGVLDGGRRGLMITQNFRN